MTHSLLFKDFTFQLPSMGLPYQGAKVPLIGGDSVSIRKYLVGFDRDFMKAMKTGDGYAIYDSLLSCIFAAPIGFDYLDLLMTDVIAIMHACKQKSLGDLVSQTYICDCQTVNVPEFSLQSLQYKYADAIPDYKSDGIDLVTSENRKLSLHLARLRDEKAVNVQLKAMRKGNRIKDEETDGRFLRYAQLIDTIDGASPPLAVKFESLLNFSNDEIDELSQVMNERDTGLVLNQVEHTCTKCGAVNVVDLGLSRDFFRSVRKRSGSSNGREESPPSDVQELQLAGTGDADTGGVGVPV